MNPALHILRPFVSRLITWRPTIIKSSYVKDISICVVDAGVEVTATWDGGEMKKVLSNAELLGHTSTLPAQSWAVTKRPCYWARQIIGAILNQRGV